MPMSDDRQQHGGAPTLIRCPAHPAELARPIHIYVIAAIGVLTAVGVALCIGSMVYVSSPALGLPLALPGVLILGVFLVWEIHTSRERARVRRMAAAMTGSTREDAATRHALLAYASGRNAPWLHARKWLETFGPGAVSFGIAPPARDDEGDPIAEPVDVGPARRRRSSRFGLRTPVTAFHVAVVLTALAALGSLVEWLLSGFSLRLAPGTPMFRLMWMVPLCLAALAHLGFRPIELSSAVAEPGRLVALSWGQRTEFTRTDSVLVLAPHRRAQAEQVMALLVRDDRRQWAHFYSGPDDPGLADLYHRWMAESPRPRAPGETPSDGVPARTLHLAATE